LLARRSDAGEQRGDFEQKETKVMFLKSCRSLLSNLLRRIPIVAVFYWRLEIAQ
jgi:hypothetical protein